MRRAGPLTATIALVVLAAAAFASSAGAMQRAWAVSCSAADACTAVGDGFAAGGAQRSGAQRWDGTGWATQAFPAIPGAADDALTAVACPTATLCFATGWAQAVPASQQTAFVARWSGSAANPAGSWSFEPLPALPAPWESSLTSISCSAADACTAVGAMDDHTNGDVARALAYRWSGGTWTLQQPANPSAQIDRLNGVACGTASFCAAVGLTDAGPLLETWDGGGWSVGAPASPPGGSGYGLRAVSCTAADACTAVGGYTGAGGFPRTLAERWDGRAWTVQDIPSSQAQNALNDVSCSSATACVAVGEGYPLAFESLIERWDGSTWTIDQIVPASGWAPLQGVSCSAPTACIAAGWAVFDDGTTRPVYERFDGASWTDVSSLVSSPPPPPHERHHHPHGRHGPPPHGRHAGRRHHRRNSTAGACVSIRRWSRTSTKAPGASPAARRCARQARARAALRCWDCSARAARPARSRSS